MKYCGLIILGFLIQFFVNGQDTVRFIGDELVNVDYHDGLLTPVVGVHNIQVLRANREHPEMADDYGWTYNHAPMLAYWNDQFFLEYLSDSVGEHVPPSQTYLVTSNDGYNWNKPIVVFPQYQIPDGTVNTTDDGDQMVVHNLKAVMHQRMGFYVTKDNRLLVLAYYGICMHIKDGPNDGNGIGRVVREIKKDGTFGPIYFIRYNHGFNQKNTHFPFYKKCKDKSFVKACDDILSNPLITMQWVEESDRNDPIIPLHKDYKAFAPYTLPDGRIVGLWKHALAAISKDCGKTWPESVKRAPGFVSNNAKIWGQKTSDGKYVTVYNPSEYRWPMAMSVSDDGLTYDHLWLVHGEISTPRYKGHEKSYGPQYIRGILEGNGTPPDGNLWVTYSVTKEDIWVSKVPVPTTNKVENQADDDFAEVDNIQQLNQWNIYNPVWCRSSITIDSEGRRWLTFSDKDPYDYSKVERIIPLTKEGEVQFDFKSDQNSFGLLHVELKDANGHPALRVIFDENGEVWTKDRSKFSHVMSYAPNEVYTIKISFDAPNNNYTVSVNGKNLDKGRFFQPVKSIGRISFRTGERRYFPNADSPYDLEGDVPHAGDPVKQAIYHITNVKSIGR